MVTQLCAGILVYGFVEHDHEMLFNGGDIDIRSSDISKVKFYKCDCFEGEMFESSAMILLFHV